MRREPGLARAGTSRWLQERCKTQEDSKGKTRKGQNKGGPARIRENNTGRTRNTTPEQPLVQQEGPASGGVWRYAIRPVSSTLNAGLSMW